MKALDARALADLHKIATTHKDETRHLRALWTQHAVGANLVAQLEWELADPAPHVRAWAVQLATETASLAEDYDTRLVACFAKQAKTDPSPVVRLYLASACQRLPLDMRWPILEGLVDNAEDAGDHNLPLMYWYAAEPLAAKEPARALALAAKAKTPNLLPFMVRRIGSSGTPQALALLADGLNKADNDTVRLTILRGLKDALSGRRQVAMPQGWPEVFANLARSARAEVRHQALALAVTFGDQRAFEDMHRVLTGPDADPTLRRDALATLLGAGDKQLAPVLHKLLADPALRAPALRGLAHYDDPHTPDALVRIYASLAAAEKRDALNTLASRPGYATALLDAVIARKIAPSEVSADIVRQLRNLNNKDLDRRIGTVWGVVRATTADRKALMEKYRKLLAAPAPSPPDLALGRAVFAKTCQQCHTLFGVGGNVGPDITGSNRADLNYLLENIVDPSAVIQKEYTATVIELKNGRVITGIVRGETPAALTVVTANDTLTVPRGEIESRTPSKQSMMPDDLLKTLTDNEVRALIAYLRSPAQVPLPAVPATKTGLSFRSRPSEPSAKR
jgi:putative heme-binding domain-containing protein